MADQDRYMPGVPCWVDTTQPDPQSAVAFYRDFFGWELEDVMPPGAPGEYHIATLCGRDVAAVGSQPEGAPQPASWNTYVWVTDAGETVAKVRAAGGSVLMEAEDVGEAGRMAIVADPAGASFCVWQARNRRGAKVVNEHAALNFNDLHTPDLDGARRFYGSVFGWEVLDVGGGLMWALAGYGDLLEQLSPGTRARMAELGAPERFEDVVASLNPTSGATAHWGVTFGIDDADAAAARAKRLGGQVVTEPVDAPWVRMTVITDPQGAGFTASQFVPPGEADAQPA